MDKKILFLGLDAAMPDLVKKFVAEGVMPNTEKLMGQGVFSRLETVCPPLTAAAWTAIVSGAGSGTNGVPSLMAPALVQLKAGAKAGQLRQCPMPQKPAEGSARISAGAGKAF